MVALAKCDGPAHSNPVLRALLGAELQQAGNVAEGKRKRVRWPAFFRQNEFDAGDVNLEAGELAALIKQGAANTAQADGRIDQIQGRRPVADTRKHRLEPAVFGDHVQKDMLLPHGRRANHPFHLDPQTVLAARTQFRKRRDRRHG